MDGFRLALTVVVMIGVVAAILLFERRRAERIEHDTREDARDSSQGQVVDEDVDDDGEATTRTE